MMTKRLRSHLEDRDSSSLYFSKSRYNDEWSERIGSVNFANNQCVADNASRLSARFSRNCVNLCTTVKNSIDV